MRVDSTKSSICACGWWRSGRRNGSRPILPRSTRGSSAGSAASVSPRGRSAASRSGPRMPAWNLPARETSSISRHRVQVVEIDGDGAVGTVRHLHAPDHGSAAAVGYDRVPLRIAPLEHGLEFVVRARMRDGIRRVLEHAPKGRQEFRSVSAVGMRQPVGRGRSRTKPDNRDGTSIRLSLKCDIFDCRYGRDAALPGRVGPRPDGRPHCAALRWVRRIRIPRSRNSGVLLVRPCLLLFSRRGSGSGPRHYDIISSSSLKLEAVAGSPDPDACLSTG